jgi:hypothetical protein
VKIALEGVKRVINGVKRVPPGVNRLLEDAVVCGDCNAAIVLPQRFRNAARARYDERIQNERELAELIGGEDSDDEMAQNKRKVRELVGGA